MCSTAPPDASDGRPPSNDGIQGIGYAYNVTSQPHMEPMYQPPWGAPAPYGMFPFPHPPPMMMGLPPGLPPGISPGLPPSHLDLGPPDHQPHMDPDTQPQGMRGSLSPPQAPHRERFSYTRYQIELLNCIYIEIRYPNTMQKQLIAKRVGITRDQVKIWFQNRRRKDVIGKTSAKEEYMQTTARKMVPNDVATSVLTELNVYENDPKGKKAKQNMNKTLEDKKRKIAVARRRSERVGSCSPGALLETDCGTPPSQSSNSPPPPTEPIREIDLFNDIYRPNNTGYKPPEVVDYNRQTPPMYTINPSFQDSSIPLPTAGLTSIEQVSLADHRQQSPHLLDSALSQSSCNTTSSLIDIAPEDGRKDLPTTHSITPLTPVAVDTDSCDGYSNARSTPSPATTDSSRCPSTEPQCVISNIDMPAPPNTVVMAHNIVPLKRSRCEDSESENDEEVEPPRKRQERLVDGHGSPPPNTIAPPSGPIDLNPVMIAPKPLSIDIPRYQTSPGPSTAHSSPNTDEGNGSETITSLGSGMMPYPEPIAWPPAQWNTRPGDAVPSLYAVPPRPDDCKDNLFMNLPPLIPTPDFMNNPYYTMPQTNPFHWDAANVLNNNNEESPKGQAAMMPLEPPRITPYGYDSGPMYSQPGDGRQELLPPWMASLPVPQSLYPQNSPSSQDVAHS